MSVVLVGSLPLGAINLSASASLSLALPLLKQLDLALSGPSGIGSLHADLAAQLDAQLNLQAKLAASLVPADSAKTLLKASLNIQAQIQALLSGAASLSALVALGVPSISASVTASIAASAALTAKLAVRVSGLDQAIKRGLTAKLPAVTFFADLAGTLSAGPVNLYSIGEAGSNTLASAGNEIQSLFAAGSGGILPTDTVYGLILLTKSPSAWASMQVMFKTS